MWIHHLAGVKDLDTRAAVELTHEEGEQGWFGLVCLRKAV